MELIFKNNLSASIESIYQERTYAGLLEGLPTQEMNERMLKTLPLTAQKRLGIDAVYAIEPLQKIIEHKEYPLGEPAQLPSVTCMVLLKYYRPARNKEMDFSMLILVWFQDTFAFPIEKGILEKVEAIDWAEFAQDCEW